MAIPTGRNYSCRIAGECAEAAVCPRYPCCLDLYAGQVFDECAVISRLRSLPESADVPRASNDGDISFKLFQCRSYVRAHKRLALIVARDFIRRLRTQSFLRTRLCHCSLDRREDRERLLSTGAMLFDQAIPKCLAVFVSGRACEQVERIRTWLRRRAFWMFSYSFFQRQRDSGRPVDEAYRTLVLKRPLNGLPLRREFGKRHERARLVSSAACSNMATGGFKSGSAMYWISFISFGRSFHQDACWVEHVQRLAQQSSRSGTMVTYPENVHAFADLRRHRD
jgi:hypothetical protein